MATKPKKKRKQAGFRKPPVRIPLDFETAVEGLLGVKPQKKTTEAKPAKKKPARSKR